MLTRCDTAQAVGLAETRDWAYRARGLDIGLVAAYDRRSTARKAFRWPKLIPVKADISAST